MDPVSSHMVNRIDDQSNRDEIDLIAIVARIWYHKFKILSSVLMAVALAVVYLLVTPKIYKIESEIAPPLAADLDVLQPESRDDSGGTSALTEESLFELVLGYLQSESVRFSYWQQAVDSDQLNQEQIVGFLDFHDDLKVSKGKKDDVASIVFDSSRPEADAELLNGFLVYVNRAVLEEVIGRVSGVMGSRRDKLSKEIELLRNHYQLQLDDEIKQLEEAFSIAKRVGIENTPYRQLANVGLNVVNNQFLLGTKTLSSQLEALKRRKGLDAFIPGLRDLQSQLSAIDADIAALAFADKSARAFVVVKPVAIPLQHDSPKVSLVLALSVVIGGVLGLMWMLCAELARSIRRREIV